MARVFITQEIRADFRQAREHGELVFLTSDYQDFNNHVEGKVNPALVDQLRRGLHDFDEDVDCVVLAGSPYVNAIVMLILGAKWVHRVKFLRWDNRGFEYIPITIEVPTPETMRHGN